MIRKAWMFTVVLLVSLATIRLTAQEQFGPPASGNTSAILFAPATLNLVAGLNGAGYGGDGGPANSATSMLSYPVGIAYDANGNLFIADSANHVVRRIDHGTGDISTFAGQEANPGFSIGGGVATSAQMQSPSGLVVDSNNNVYVADRANNVVFKITPAGVISIFAGSGTAGYGGDGGSATAPAAEFNNPWALGIDASNNIYVADTANNLIRKVTQAGNLSTFAGDNADLSGCNASEYSTGAPPYTALQAHLCFPQGVAFDPAGNAYITDTKNDIIRKVDNSGNLTAFAGTFRTPGFSGDGGPATSAWFDLPAGLYVDPAGRVYISDFFNERIRVVDTLGNINTVFGDGFGSLNASSIGGPDTEANTVNSGPANGIYDFVLDQDGNIIATDSSSNAVTSAGTTGQYIFSEQNVFNPSVAKYVTVENPSGVPLDFLGAPTLIGPYSLATGAAAGTCNFSGTLPAGQTCTIGVVFTPIVDDTKNPGSLTLTTNANSSPSTITFTGMSDGTGITSASLTGPGSSFTATVGQTSAPEAATLKNTGQTAVTITSTSFNGNNPTEFAIGSTTCPTSPATLASGATCVFNLTFTPVNTTTASAAFNVVIANYGQIGVVLDGVGTAAGPPAATPVISPASGTYNAPVAVQITDSSATPTIYYTTTGSAPVVGTSPTYSSVITVTQSGTEVQAVATATGDGTSNAAAPTTYTVQPYIQFNPAMVGVAAGSAQQLTAQFSLQGIVAPTASLHYGQDYTMGTFSCVPNGTIEACSAAITFIPTLPGARKDALFLMNGSARVATVLLDGTGQAPLALIQPGVVTQAINTHGNGLFNSTVDENGTVYALSSSTNAITVMTKAGVVSNLPVTGLSSPRTISIDGAGVLYIHGSTDDAAMMTYDTVQSVQGSLALPGTHFWLDTSIGNTGNLYALAGDTGVFYTIKPDGTSTNATLSPTDPGADAMAVDSAEDVFVGGQTTSEINPNGTQTGFSNVDAQNAVIVDAANSIYAAPYTGFDGIVELPASNYNGAPIADLDPAELLVLGASMRSDGTLFVGSVSGLDQVDRSQGAINFGTQIAETASAAQTVSLYNGGNENLTLTNFVLAGGASGFALQAAGTNPCTVGMTVVPGALCNVAVTLTAPSAGTFSGTVTFTTNTLNMASTNQVVALAGVVDGINVTASPNPLNFADQLEGTSSAAQTITLTNGGAIASAVIQTPLPAANGYALGIGTCTSPIAPGGGTCQLSVTFSPTAAQAYDDVVALTAISQGVGANQTVNLSVNGTGTTAAIPTASLSPATLNFGGVQIDTTSPPLIETVTNSGGGSLNISGVSIAQTGNTVFFLSTGANQCTNATSLTAGQSCNVYVTFKPAVNNQTSNATLQIADNATGSPQTAALTGVGDYFYEPVGSSSSKVPVSVFITTGGTLSATNVVTMGAQTQDYVLQSGGTCAMGTAYTAGQVCAVDVIFTPQFSGARNGSIYLTDASGNVLGTTFLLGTGDGPQLIFGPVAPQSVTGYITDLAGVAVDGADDLFYVNDPNDLIEVPASGPAVTVANLSSLLNGSTTNNVAIDTSGNLFIASDSATPLIEVPTTGTGTWGTPVAINTGGVANVAQVATDALGNLYITAPEQNAVYQLPFTGTGYGTPVALPFPGGGAFKPEGVAVDLYLDVYAIGQNTSNNQTEVIELPANNNGYGSPVTTTLAQLTYGTGVGTDANGDLYVGGLTSATTGGIYFVPASGSPILVGAGYYGFFVLDGASNIFAVQANFSDQAQIAEIPQATPPSLTFASTNVGATSTDSPKTISVTNVGNEQLNFYSSSSYPTDFPENNSDDNVCNAEFPLKAGAKCDVSVDFTPTATGSLSEVVILNDNNLNGSQASQSIQVSGTATGAGAQVATLTPSLAFSSTTVGSTASVMSATLSNTGNATLNITGITIVGANPADFAIATGANACGTTLSGDASCSIYVTFTPASASGFTATLQVADNATGSSQTSILTGTGTAQLAPVATLAPNPVAFASQLMGTTSATTTVTLTNSGNATLTITGITIGGTNPTDFAMGTGSNACGSSVAAGASCNIYLTFTPAAAASYTATLTVADNAPGSPQNVALSGSGANPPDFSVVGTPASQTVAPGGSTSFNITVNSSGGTFSNAVALTVSGLPTGATGSFSPASVTPGSESASSTLTVQTGTSTQQTAQNSAWPLAAPALAALGLFFIPGKRRRRWITLGMLLLASLGTLTALSGCGGGFRFGQPAQTYTLTITGTSGNDTHSTTVQLTVQ